MTQVLCSVVLSTAPIDTPVVEDTSLPLGEGEDRDVLQGKGDHDEPHEEEPYCLYALPHSDRELVGTYFLVRPAMLW